MLCKKHNSIYNIYVVLKKKGKFIMKKAISVLMIAACMLCMVTACEKKDKKENDTSASQATETDCTAAELVTTEPEGEITISED